MKLAAIEIRLVYVGYFKLAAFRRLDVGGDIDDLLVVEVESGYSPARLGLRRLFFDAKRSHLIVEIDDAVPLRVGDMV